MKQTVLGIELLRSLTRKGLKIFTSKQAKETAPEIGMKSEYVAESLHHLLKANWIVRLKRGVYALSRECGFGEPPHQFEIAMALVPHAAISHWTALHQHGLAQEVPTQIFAITPKSTSIPRSLLGGNYRFIRIHLKFYFGLENHLVGKSEIRITDLERTLLDGLMFPQYCGNFQNVIHAFKRSEKRLNVEKIIQYGLKLDHATIKRLGWMLEKLSIEEKDLKQLLKFPIKGYRKLNPDGEPKGVYNKKWMLQENFSEADLKI